MNEQNAKYDALLEWVYERAGGSMEPDVVTAPFAAEAGIPLDECMHLTKRLKADAFLRKANSFGGGEHLTSEGVARVRAIQERRKDPLARNLAARTQVLRWHYQLDEMDKVGVYLREFADSDLARFEGTRFTAREIEKAAAYLSDHELIEGVIPGEFDYPVTATITKHGRTCIERFGGNVNKFLDSQGRGGPQFNIEGGVHGNVAMGTDFTQRVNSGADLPALGKFVQNLLQELPGFEAADDTKAKLAQALAETQQELDRATPDRGRVAAAFSKVSGYLMEAGKPVVSAAIMLAAQGQGWVPPSA